MFREALFLAFKWDQFNKNGFLSSDTWDLDKLSPEDPLFQKYPALLEKERIKIDLEKQETGNSLYQLLKTEMPKDLSSVSTKHIIGFNSKKISNVTVRTFFTGPEDNTSDWEKALIDRVHLAKDRIFIDQMYFQPSYKLMKEIIDAANRGVKVTVVTTTGGRHNSKGEKFFGHRNLHNLHILFSSAKTKTNIDAYTFSQAKNGLHKKVVVVDDYVLAGSSNMGTKSLELTSDHEMNFEAHSREFADQTLKIIKEDIKKSKQIKQVSLTVLNRIYSFIHHTGSGIWG